MHCIVGGEVLLPGMGCFSSLRPLFDGQPCVLPRVSGPGDDPQPPRAAAGAQLDSLVLARLRMASS